MSARQDAEDLAAFCLATGVQPSEYWSLTRLEREIFVKYAKRRKG